MAGDDDTRDDSSLTGGTDSEASRITTLDAIQDKLDKLAEQVASMARGGTEKAHDAAAEHTVRRLERPTTTLEAAEDRRREIRDELAALRKQEQADAQAAALNDRIGKLEKAAEKVPRQFRKIEQLMGWHRS